jgi:serine/threonine protein kinase
MIDLLQPGEIFAGRYRIDRFLAQGGFGAVYVAEQLETELAVALKVLWPHVLHSQDAVEKFKLEARVAGRVGSEHIVKVFDAGFDADSGMPFLVMELLQGSHLQHLVESQGPLPGATLVTYFRQIASALDKAHLYVDRDGAARPIVHRDLKPENLFLAKRETGDAIVKILDFGIAKVLSNSTNVSQDVKGTPLYMAYEQAAAGKITPQTDIWALGLIAFYLLTGRCYWKTANLPEAALTQLFGEVLALPIDAPSQRARELKCEVVPNAEFDAWFARCVNREAALRFATAGECAAALSGALLGSAVPSKVSSAQAVAFGATTPLMSSSKGPVVVPSATASAASAVGGTTVQPLSVGSTGAALPIPKTRSTPVVALLVVAALVVVGVVAARVLRTGADSQVAEAGSAGPAATPQLLQSAAPSLPVMPSVSSTPLAAAGSAPAAIPSVAPSALIATPRVAARAQARSPLPSAKPPADTKPKGNELYDDR